MNTIREPERAIPVVHETDIAVIGGSCTGVFAAVRAARPGMRVAIVEQQNCFGGMATAGAVNVRDHAAGGWGASAGVHGRAGRAH